MRILDKDDNELFETDIDFSVGELIEEKLFICHHGKQEPVEEQGHYETIAEYDNGGKDVKWVVDVEKVEEKEAYDEYEDILRYTPFSEKKVLSIKLQREKIEILNWFNDTDYMVLKVFRGNWSADDNRYIKYLDEYELKKARYDEIENTLKGM